VSIVQGWSRPNYYQAIALTGDAEAHAILKSCFSRIWDTAGLMDDAKFINWIALDAIWCIKELLELAEDPEPYRPAYGALIGHSCKRVTEQAESCLSEYFD